MQVGGAGDGALERDLIAPAVSHHRAMDSSPLPARRPPRDFIDLTVAEAPKEPNVDLPATTAELDEVLAWLRLPKA
jgi:hypothetical protein